MILILSFLDNKHVNKVCKYLRSDYEIIDTAWFPSQMTMHAYAGKQIDEMFLDLPSGRRIALDNVSAVWCRRIKQFTYDKTLTDETGRLFAWSECTEGIQGLWYSMECYWMNSPTADEVALRKVVQHRVACRMGLSIPETLVTNGPKEAQAFIEKHAKYGVIRKAFRNIPQAPRETLKVGPAEMEKIANVRFAPVIFQQYIPVALDLRVTVVDSEIFATSFQSAPEYEVDYRSGIGTATVAPYDLPDDIAEKLLKLMNHFDLKYGAVDFRVTPEGEHVFFEVNPAGEYLFASERTGQPIPQAIAAALDRNVQKTL